MFLMLKKGRGREKKKRESEVSVLLEKYQDLIGNIPLNHKFVGEKTNPLHFPNYAYVLYENVSHIGHLNSYYSCGKCTYN